ncbi:Spo0E family sporulation regulatory protein-aspartic acid phosphatase, partial [Anaerosolibacter sp.]|uniref:Spo0E family sporulation regulatory protein-aspartic acid phosphatase n=1 Tax=Anaerosolibacter sp. TaxID=1872527 RepID=UPI0039EE20A1
QYSVEEYMQIYDEILQKIENLRNIMHDLIDKDPTLIDPQILSVSQEIDRLLNQLYNAGNQGQN